MKLMRKKEIILALLLMFTMVTLAACGDSEPEGEKVQQQAGGDVEQAEDFKVVIENIDRTITFDRVPERAVTLNQHVTEIMLALGLEDHMVGTAFLDDEILPEFQEQYSKIPVLSDRYPSQEVFLSVEPDFAYAGWQSAFREDNVGTVEQLEQFGVKAYLHKASYEVGPTLEDLFEDILNIGRIFDVQDRAEELIASMEREFAEVQEQIGEVEEPIRIFVYDSGEDTPFTVAQGFMTTIINLAGGKNIFDDVDRNWAQVSWEEVINRDPEVIVVVDYGETTVEQKKELLLNKSALANVTAIQNERFVVIPLSAAAEGVRIVSAFETLSKGLYPEKFD